MSKKACFVICPIGEPSSATRKRSDQILKYIIEPVLDGSEWQIERADKISEPGIITNQIIERLVGADLVIADLSERNPNVFYELAVRHITRKPYVHLIAHDEDIPFDNAPVRAIKIDISDLDSVHEAKLDLEQQVNHALSPGSVIDSPISVSLALTDLRTSGDSEAVLLETIYNELATLRRSVSGVESKLARMSRDPNRAGDNYADQYHLRSDQIPTRRGLFGMTLNDMMNFNENQSNNDDMQIDKQAISAELAKAMVESLNLHHNNKKLKNDKRVI